MKAIGSRTPLILFRTISWCQHLWLRNKMNQCSFASFAPVNTFPKNKIFRHQHWVHRQTAIAWYVFLATRSHRNKKRHDAHVIESSRCLPWPLLGSVRPPVSHEKSSMHSVASVSRFHSYHRQLYCDTHIYLLFHSVWNCPLFSLTVVRADTTMAILFALPSSYQ